MANESDGLNLLKFDDFFEGISLGLDRLAEMRRGLLQAKDLEKTHLERLNLVENDLLSPILWKKSRFLKWVGNFTAWRGLLFSFADDIEIDCFAYQNLSEQLARFFLENKNIALQECQVRLNTSFEMELLADITVLGEKMSTVSSQISFCREPVLPVRFNSQWFLLKMKSLSDVHILKEKPTGALHLIAKPSSDKNSKQNLPVRVQLLSGEAWLFHETRPIETVWMRRVDGLSSFSGVIGTGTVDGVDLAYLLSLEKALVHGKTLRFSEKTV